jgi:hypothetical protein
VALGVVVGVLEKMVAAADPAELPLIAAKGAIARFKGDTAAGRKATLVDLMQTVLVPLFDELNTTHGIDNAKITKLLADPATVAAPVEANNLTKSDPKPLDHGLRRYYSVAKRELLFDASIGMTIFSAFRAAGNAWTPDANVDNATKQLVHLGALKGFFCRVLVAIRAAKAAGTTLAEAFALYRTEGNMVMPLDVEHMTKLLPPFERKFDFHYTDQAYRLGLKVMMQNAAWSQTTDAFVKANGRGGGDFDTYVRANAFIDWHIIMVGFDYLGARFEAKKRVEDWTTTYIKFLMDVRIANGTPEADRAAVKTALETEASAIFMKLNKGETGGRLFVTPSDPDGALRLASFILTQGLFFMKAAGKPEVDGPFIQPNKSLQYLAYNTSHRRSMDPKEDLFSSVMASAAVALTQLADAPAYCSNAFTILGLAGLPNKLPSKSESDEHAAAAAKVKTALTDPAEMEEFAQFILRATAKEWKSYPENRGNLARYTRLLKHYTALTAGMNL